MTVPGWGRAPRGGGLDACCRRLGKHGSICTASDTYDKSGAIDVHGVSADLDPS